MALKERGQMFHNAIKVKVSWKGDIRGGSLKVQCFTRQGCWSCKKQMTQLDAEVGKTLGNLKGAKNWLISKPSNKLSVRHCVGPIERVSTTLNLKTHSFSKINGIDQKFITYLLVILLDQDFLLTNFNVYKKIKVKFSKTNYMGPWVLQS